MKCMRFFRPVMFVALATLLLTSCRNDEGRIVGRWEVRHDINEIELVGMDQPSVDKYVDELMGHVFEFSEDGNLTISNEDGKIYKTAKYIIDKDHLMTVVTDKGEEIWAINELRKRKMSLSYNIVEKDDDLENIEYNISHYIDLKKI